MRAFVAIDVGPPVESETPPGPRPEAHLTLRFLGNVDRDREAGIVEALRAAAAPVKPFDMTLEGVGAFPSRERPRVVWVGATAGHDRLLFLAGRISESLARIGFPGDREPFVPHVTLFRVRGPRDRSRARALLEGTVPPPPPRPVRVVEILWKESELTPAGAVHRTRERIALGTARGPTD